MKTYNNFIKEDLQQVKDDIADKVAQKEVSGKDNVGKVDKMDIEEKPNLEINKSIEDTIEKFETQKKVITDKIDFFNKQIENLNKQVEVTSNPDEKTNLINKIKDTQTTLTQLEEEIGKFDELIKTSTEQKTSLEDK